jgi:hypothetical protein
VLVAILSGDLLDAACDPLPRVLDGTTIEAGDVVHADGCAGTCIADCHCCSAIDGPAIDAVADPLGFVGMAASVIRKPAPWLAVPPPDEPPTLL